MTGPSGIHCVLYAFFDSAGRLDRGAMRAQVDAVRTVGVDGVTVLGLATEVGKLSVDERRDVIAWAAEDIAGRCPLSVTIAGASIAEQREMMAVAADHGADCLILQPPGGGAIADDGLLEYFSAIMRDIELPMGVQNAPQFLGQSLAPEEISKLKARIENFSFIKSEGNAVDLATLVQSAGPSLRYLGGRGGLEMTDCLRAGADGFVLAPDAIDYACRVFDLWTAGEIDAAEAAHIRALPALVFMMQSIDHLICYGKRIFALRSGLTVHDRMPALQPTDMGLQFCSHWAEHLGPMVRRDITAGPVRTAT